MSAPRPRPRKTSAARTKKESSAAVAFSQVRPYELSAGTRIRAVKATRLIRTAPPKRKYSVPIFARASMRPLILAQARDGQGGRGAARERGDPQAPARGDVAEVVDAQVHARQAHDDGQRDPDGDQGRRP